MIKGVLYNGRTIAVWSNNEIVRFHGFGKDKAIEMDVLPSMTLEEVEEESKSSGFMLEVLKIVRRIL